MSLKIHCSACFRFFLLLCLTISIIIITIIAIIIIIITLMTYQNVCKYFVINFKNFFPLLYSNLIYLYISVLKIKINDLKMRSQSDYLYLFHLYNYLCTYLPLLFCLPLHYTLICIPHFIFFFLF